VIEQNQEGVLSMAVQVSPARNPTASAPMVTPRRADDCVNTLCRS